jgi:hypothetical protein
MRQDDIDSSDVMAASADMAKSDGKADPDADTDAKKPATETATTTDEDLSLSTGGGLMDALMDKDPTEVYSEAHLA